MGVPIRSGTVLIREGIRLPENLDLESIAWMPGWRILKTLVGFSVGQAAQHAGWAFQFVGDSLQGNAIGGGEKTLHRALRGILAGLRASRFNALEVTAVTTNRFLGVPYVSITAYSRHISEGVSFGLLRQPGLDAIRPS